MESAVSDKLREDLSRLAIGRREANESMLKMLEDACDSLLYW